MSEWKAIYLIRDVVGPVSRSVEAGVSKRLPSTDEFHLTLIDGSVVLSTEGSLPMDDEIPVWTGEDCDWSGLEQELGTESDLAASVRELVECLTVIEENRV